MSDRNQDGVSPAERRTLRLIRNLGPRTRAQMTRDLGVSATTAMRVVDSLAAKGLLREGEKIIDGPGQPSATVMLVADAAYAMGVSIMTDAFTLLLMDLVGTVVAECTVRCEIGDRAQATATLEKAIRYHLSENDIPRHRLRGVGIGVPGFFVDGANQFNTPDRIAQWSFVDLHMELAQTLKLSVLVENDGNAAAVGEAMVGVGRWANSFAYLYFADGFGGGVIVDGEPLRGSRGNAGEFNAALARLGMPKPDLQLLRQCLDAAAVKTSDIADLCVRFDPAWPGIEAWLELVTPSVTHVADTISGVLDPDAIVLGGRIPSSLAQMLAARINIDAGSRRSRGRHVPKVTPSAAGADAVALGSAALVMKAALYA